MPIKIAFSTKLKISTSTNTTPIKPSSSAKTANTKSVCASGKYSSF
ncbi:Uncharacterised protein [Vibrio cholerae]|nr:Uncharacterised protein [Vibrio cholerae]